MLVLTTLVSLLPAAATDVPFAGPGIAFAAIFSDHAVLQRSPQVSSVYGVVIGDAKAAGVSVAVTPSSGGGAYTVQAAHFEVVNATYMRWRAALKPTAAA